MLAAQIMTTFAAEEFVEYKNASVIPIYRAGGTALVLLGKEHRRRSGEVWCEFFGKKDKEDNNNPLVTAQREAFEESANQLRFVKPIHQYQGKRNTSTIHFIWEVDYVDPQAMRDSAKKIRKSGKKSHVEKTDWQWVTLKDLLEGNTGLNLHWTIADKLKNKSIRPILESLCGVGQKPKKKPSRKKK